MASVDEIKAMAQADLAQPNFTPAPSAPAPTQLQSLIDQPTRAPTDVELGVAQLRAMSPLEQAAADLEGRKLLFQEGLSFGVLPKVGAAATSLKEALYGTPITEAFGQAVTQQDILKEFTRQKELENDNLILGLTGPELAGGLVSPIGRLYTPTKVAAGTPLASALATRGLNIGKAAGTGAGAAGLQTFLSTPGTLEERLLAAEKSAEIGAEFGGGFGTLGQIASMAGPKIRSLGRAAQRSAIGARQGDYLKTASKKNFVPNQEGTYTLTQQGIDNVIEKGYLGDSFNPMLQSNNLNVSMRQLNDSLDNKIAAVDSAGVQVKTPQFINLVQNIQKGRDFGGINRQRYADKLNEIKADIASQKTNRLQYLQDQKKYFGSLYDPTGTSADAKFNRAVYHELQSVIEQHIPEAKNINEDLQSIILTKPIIDRRKAEASAGANKLFQALGRATYTTGGLFGAGARLAGTGPTGAILLSAGTKGAASPTGRNIIGQILSGGLSSANINNTGLRLGQLASRPEVVSIPNETIVDSAPTPTPPAVDLNVKDILAAAEAELGRSIIGPANIPTPEPTLEPETITVGKQNISIPTGEGFAPVNLVKAVMQVESAGDPLAISSKGARGLMQLMPATAKMLGVDPSDPQQNVEGGSKYLQQQINAFDDVKLGLAAYNWGPGSIRSAISDAKSNDWETIVKRLGVKYKQNSKIKERAGAPKNSRYGVPEETYLYVTKVLNNLEKLNNLVEA
jgi:hypothetical protein